MSLSDHPRFRRFQAGQRAIAAARAASAAEAALSFPAPEQPEQPDPNQTAHPLLAQVPLVRPFDDVNVPPAPAPTLVSAPLPTTATASPEVRVTDASISSPVLPAAAPHDVPRLGSSICEALCSPARRHQTLRHSDYLGDVAPVPAPALDPSLPLQFLAASVVPFNGVSAPNDAQPPRGRLPSREKVADAVLTVRPAPLGAPRPAPLVDPPSSTAAARTAVWVDVSASTPAVVLPFPAPTAHSPHAEAPASPLVAVLSVPALAIQSPPANAHVQDLTPVEDANMAPVSALVLPAQPAGSSSKVDIALAASPASWGASADAVQPPRARLPSRQKLAEAVSLAVAVPAGPDPDDLPVCAPVSPAFTIASLPDSPLFEAPRRRSGYAELTACAKASSAATDATRPPPPPLPRPTAARPNRAAAAARSSAPTVLPPKSVPALRRKGTATRIGKPKSKPKSKPKPKPTVPVIVLAPAGSASSPVLAPSSREKRLQSVRRVLSYPRTPAAVVVAVPGPRPYSCAKCDKAFDKVSNLKAHMRVHTGDMPFKCTFPTCGNSYKWQSSLNFHERLHLNKPDDAMKSLRTVATKIPDCFRVPSSAAAVPVAAVAAAKKADAVVVIDGSDNEGEDEGKRKGKPGRRPAILSAAPLVFIPETDDEDNGEGETGESCESALQPVAPPDECPEVPSLPDQSQVIVYVDGPKRAGEEERTPRAAAVGNLSKAEGEVIAVEDRAVLAQQEDKLASEKAGGGEGEKDEKKKSKKKLAKRKKKSVLGLKLASPAQVIEPPSAAEAVVQPTSPVTPPLAPQITPTSADRTIEADASGAGAEKTIVTKKSGFERGNAGDGTGKKQGLKHATGKRKKAVPRRLPAPVEEDASCVVSDRFEKRVGVENIAEQSSGYSRKLRSTSEKAATGVTKGSEESAFCAANAEKKMARPDGDLSGRPRAVSLGTVVEAASGISARKSGGVCQKIVPIDEGLKVRAVQRAEEGPGGIQALSLASRRSSGEKFLVLESDDAGQRQEGRAANGSSHLLEAACTAAVTVPDKPTCDNGVDNFLTRRSALDAEDVESFGVGPVGEGDCENAVVETTVVGEKLSDSKATRQGACASLADKSELANSGEAVTHTLREGRNGESLAARRDDLAPRKKKKKNDKNEKKEKKEQKEEEKKEKRVKKDKKRKRRAEIALLSEACVVDFAIDDADRNKKKKARTVGEESSRADVPRGKKLSRKGGEIRLDAGGVCTPRRLSSFVEPDQRARTCAVPSFTPFSSSLACTDEDRRGLKDFLERNRAAKRARKQKRRNERERKSFQEGVAGAVEE